MENFKVIIVEDVPLELKGTEGIFKNDIPEAEIIGTAESEIAYWKLIKQQLPDLVLLDLGLGGSTTVGVEICRQTKEQYPDVKVLIFTGEILNEKLWVDVLDAGCDGIILKSGELLTRGDVASCMGGKKLVFNQPILQKIVDRFKRSVNSQLMRQEALVNYEIDEYDERIAVKNFIAELRGGEKSKAKMLEAEREQQTDAIIEATVKPFAEELYKVINLYGGRGKGFRKGESVAKIISVMAFKDAVHKWENENPRD